MWYCSDRTSLDVTVFSWVCRLFLPLDDELETTINDPANFRWDGSCKDCTVHYVGYNGLGYGLSPAIETITWQSALSGIVAAS